MEFQNLIQAMSVKMLEKLSVDALDSSESGSELLTGVTSRALQHYSTLYLFLAENKLEQEYLEWLTSKNADITYGL